MILVREFRAIVSFYNYQGGINEMYKNLPATSFLISPVVAALQGFTSDSFRWMILWLCLDPGMESS